MDNYLFSDNNKVLTIIGYPTISLGHSPTNDKVIINKFIDKFNNVECIKLLCDVEINVSFPNLLLIEKEKDNIVLSLLKNQPKIEAICILNCSFYSLSLPNLKCLECLSNYINFNKFPNLEELVIDNYYLTIDNIPNNISRLVYHMVKKENILNYHHNYNIITFTIQHNKECRFNLFNLNDIDIVIDTNNNKIYGQIENINELIIETTGHIININNLKIKNIRKLILKNVNIYLDEKLNCQIETTNSIITYRN